MNTLQARVEHLADRLEPQTLEHLRGQPELVEALQEIIDLSRGRDHPLPPVLLIGPDGVGKAGVGRVVIREFQGQEGSLFEVAQGDFEDLQELAEFFSDLEDGDAVLVHRLEEFPEEWSRLMVYLARHFEFPGRHGEEEGAMVALFSLVATTAQDVAPEAMESWITARVFPPSEAQLVEMAQWSALRLGGAITDGAARLLVAQSGGGPRRLNEALAQVVLENAEKLEGEHWLIDEDLVGGA